MRLEKLRAWLWDSQLAGVLITSPANIFYYSNFQGSNAALVVDRNGGSHLLTDFRYISQAKTQLSGWNIIDAEGPLFSVLPRLLNEQAGLWVFEGKNLTVDTYQTLPNLEGIEFISKDFDFLREMKESEEIARIRQAAAISDEAFHELLHWITPGKTEREVQIFLDYQMLQLGAEGQSFSTIVGSGPNGALPHATPGKRKLQKGDLVVLDFGARYEGYCSDMTRTISIGKADQKQKEIYHIVLEAQLKALEEIRSGVSNLHIDRLSRNYIEQAGYGSFFGHGLGHSLGIEIHENPRFSPKAEEVFLQENMVMTVEPGIYLPGWGGVRIEDLVVVKANHYDNLTATTKELIEI